ncbi:MAG: hypothetical protein JKY71_09895 [Alphaproteobacteria bacterium]|nr:hypothetical protein [Alphaproteobacteria bacterium]
MEIFSAFIGAVLAFAFAFFLYVYQKKSQDGYYLAFVIAYITSQISKLYSLKKDILVVRNSEIQKLEQSFNTTVTEGESVNLEMREISQFITNPSHSEADVCIDKISFLADSDPNLILLVKAALDADSGVTEIIHGCNEQIKETKADMSLPNVWLLVQFNKNLIDQVDYTIALLEHSQSQLIEFSKNEFKHFVTITGFSLDEEYKKFKPHLSNSLLSIQYTYKPKSFLEGICKFLQRLKSCI